MFGSVVNKLAAAVRRLLSPYAVGSFEPALAYDFVNGTYRTNNTTQSPEAAFTHTRSGNATMVDSDGLLKWGPHNLLTYSEQFDNGAWDKLTASVTANLATAPDGTTTADKLIVDSGTPLYPSGGTTEGGIRQSFAAATGAAHTFGYSIYAEAAEFDSVTLMLVDGGNVSRFAGATFNLAAGTATPTTGNWSATALIEDVGGGIYRCTVVITTIALVGSFIRNYVNVSDSTATTGDGTSGIYIWGAHVYRSDLGGMVNNPATGDSYVPTTSSARYLPRIGNHIYNGSAWVNEGMLHESEARTNLFDHSQNIIPSDIIDGTTDDGDVLLGIISNKVIVSPTTIDTSTGQGFRLSGIGSSTGTHTWSLFVKGGNGIDSLRVRRYSINVDTTTIGLFDLTTGTATNASGVLNSIDVGGGIYYIWWIDNVNAVSQAGFDVKPDITETADGVNYFEIFAPQMEEGSTPSSYIPTSGSTVTRAADTLVVPSANMPWPTPEYIGPELVTNGTLNASGRLSSYSYSDGEATVGMTWDGVNPDGYLRIRLTGFTVGKVYQVDFSSDNTYTQTNSAYSNQVRTTSETVLISATSEQQGALFFSLPFIATETTLDVLFYSKFSGELTYTYSVREINPLSVSIQMDGLVTYADTGQNAEYTPLDWRADGDNFITTETSTASTRTGKPIFIQEASGTQDAVLATSDYSPGVNVPYNIASRHGSTFVNGAVDGTALTANTTPVALPDLSSTDLSLGYDYMGNIGTFRVWSQDIGDDGIEEATS